jgi:hypothetical protein
MKKEFVLPLVERKTFAEEVGFDKRGSYYPMDYFKKFNINMLYKGKMVIVTRKYKFEEHELTMDVTLFYVFKGEESIRHRYEEKVELCYTSGHGEYVSDGGQLDDLKMTTVYYPMDEEQTIGIYFKDNYDKAHLEII